VFDTKPYDRDSLQKATPNGEIDWKFMEFRLRSETAAAAQGAQAACIFVNDHADRATLEQLHSARVRHIVLRCAG